MNDLEGSVGVGFFRMENNVQEPFRRRDAPTLWRGKSGSQLLEKTLLRQAGDGHALTSLEEEKGSACHCVERLDATVGHDGEFAKTNDVKLGVFRRVAQGAERTRGVENTQCQYYEGKAFLHRAGAGTARLWR